jgi:hypothetical protein
VPVARLGLGLRAAAFAFRAALGATDREGAVADVAPSSDGAEGAIAADDDNDDAAVVVGLVVDIDMDDDDDEEDD